jgi:RimJ/RimL family protein N-acetyltransferase
VTSDLGTERLILRAIEERDIDTLTEIFADYKMVFMLTFIPWLLKRSRVVDYVKNISWNTGRERSLYWAIPLPLLGSIGGSA